MKEDWNNQHYIEKKLWTCIVHFLHFSTWIQNHMLKIALSLGLSKTRWKKIGRINITLRKTLWTCILHFLHFSTWIENHKLKVALSLGKAKQDKIILEETTLHWERSWTCILQFAHFDFDTKSYAESRTVIRSKQN